MKLHFGLVFVAVGILCANVSAQWQSTGLSNCGPVTAMVYSSAHPVPYLYAATFNGVYRSSDEAETWTKQNTGLQSTNANDLIACDTLLFCAVQGGVFRSSDGAESWSWSGLQGVFVTSLSMQKNRMMAATRSGVYVSYDTALTWQAYSDGLPPAYMNDIIQIDTAAFVASSFGVYWRTPSMTTWMPRNSGLSDTNAQVLLSAGPYVLCGTRGRVYLSSNQGSAWHQLYNQMNDNLIYSLCIAQGSILAGGLSVCIADTAAKQWRSTTMPDSDNCSFLVRGDVIYAGNGNRVWKSSVTALLALLQSTPDEKVSEGWSISPNPASSHICLRGSAALDQAALVQIIALDGSIVRSETRTLQAGCVNEECLDVSDLPKGLYFVRLIAGSLHRTFSFVH